MSWTTEQIERLIEGYSNHPQLYAVKNPDYHNKNKRQIALNNILESLQRPGTTTVGNPEKVEWFTYYVHK